MTQPYTETEILIRRLQRAADYEPSSARHQLLQAAADELERMNSLLNAPEIHEFTEAVAREAAHQRGRWGTEHDSGKSAIEWFWLIGFLATKATQAERYGDHEKYLHHIVTTAAACANWHAHAAGTNTDMRPGAPESLETEPSK